MIQPTLRSRSFAHLVEGDVNNLCDVNSDGDYEENCPDVFIHDRSSGEMIFLALIVKD